MNIEKCEQLITDDRPYIAKLIKICNLPDGYYKEQLSKKVISTNSTIWVVGKPGNKKVGDWAAYIGHPVIIAWKPEYISIAFDYATQRLFEPDGVVKHGDKLFETEADLLFPEYEHLVYRY